MSRIALAKDIYWVGAVDWNLREFHGYTTHRGTTYNAYLIVDDKIALVDTVKAPFVGAMLSHIKEIVDPRDIDYVISNHVEMDHSGSLPAIIPWANKAKLITMERFGADGLKKTFHCDWPLMPVKDGQGLQLGRRHLKFIHTPMLHWPDSMCTYVKEENLLFSMDIFAEHLGTVERFDDEVDMAAVMAEASKYYANLLMPFGNLVLGALGKLKREKIEMIATSHGIVWRSHLPQILNAYTRWARSDTKPKALVVYDTMWGSTEKMAQALVDSIAAEGIEVKLCNLTVSDRSDVISEVLESKVLLVGSPTLNNGPLPTMAAFLSYLQGLKPKNKLAATFSSYGWGGGAKKIIEDALLQSGLEVIPSDLEVKFVPTAEELEKCAAFGKKVVTRIRETVKL